jgi:hypothetical protein
MSLHSTEPPAKVGNLSFASQREGTNLTLTLNGSAELRTPDSLAQALLMWHDQFLSLGLHLVSVDFRAVEFMNSSALSAFLQWFTKLKAAASGYKVDLIYDTQVRWQRGSISALGSFAVDHVSVRNAPKA